MWRLPIRSPHASAVTIFCLAIPLIACCARLLFATSPQANKPRQDLHGVISHAILTPPLRSPEVELRYSPDGKYLILQDLAGVSILVKNPLRILFHISANQIYPAQFSADSQYLVLVSRALTIGKWKLPEGVKIASAELPVKEECLDGQLSPGGDFFACTTPDFHFVLFDVFTQKVVFEDSTIPILVPLPGRSTRMPFNFFFSSLDSNTAFAGPFGLVETVHPTSNANHSLFTSAIHFSPDAKTLIANLPAGSLGLDLTTKKRFEPPSAVEKTMLGTVALLRNDRVVAVGKGKGKEKPDAAAMLSLKNGKVLSSFPFTADRIRIASNPRFAVIYNYGPDAPSAGAFDLEQNRLVDTPPNFSLDINGDEMAVYSVNCSIALYKVGERSLRASLPLPLNPLPILRSASTTPDLEKLALAVDGSGAIFQVSNGQREASLPTFSAVNFPDPQAALLLLPRNHENLARVSRVNLSDGASSPSWEVGKEQQLRAGGPVFLEYTFKKGSAGPRGEVPESGVQSPYRLRAIDPGGGKELWKRDFEDNPPTPFADPQGERLVLGWKAKSPEAKDAASHSPSAHEIYKKAKLTDHDSFFEALDARTGKSVGGFLLQAGNGAASFDAAFSLGDVMILTKDELRVSIYSLIDGQLKARLVGLRPAASAQTNLLALDLGGNRVGIYDLLSGAKLDEQLFPDLIAYLHFSGDGKRLFVLTEHQAVAILDMSKVREADTESSKSADQKN
jgi:hypothetical protein